MAKNKKENGLDSPIKTSIKHRNSKFKIIHSKGNEINLVIS